MMMQPLRKTQMPISYEREKLESIFKMNRVESWIVAIVDSIF